MNYREIYLTEHLSTIDKLQAYSLAHITEFSEISWREIYAELEEFKKFINLELDLEKEIKNNR